jgi:hypothetical protein
MKTLLIALLGILLSLSVLRSSFNLERLPIIHPFRSPFYQDPILSVTNVKTDFAFQLMRLDIYTSA